MSFRMIYLAKRNPQVAFEDWPRTWRSHAVYVSQFAAIGAAIDKLHYCARQSESPQGWTQEYDGAALIDSASRETLTGTMGPEERKLVDADERRVFSTLVDEFTMEFERTSAAGECRGKGAAIRFLARRSGLDRAAFLDRLEAHARVARGADGATVARGHEQYAIAAPPPPGYPFDGVTIDWFGTPEQALVAANDGSLALLGADLARFCDAERSVNLLTRVIHEWPRATE